MLVLGAFVFFYIFWCCAAVRACGWIIDMVNWTAVAGGHGPVLYDTV